MAAVQRGEGNPKIIECNGIVRPYRNRLSIAGYGFLAPFQGVEHHTEVIVLFCRAWIVSQRPAQ